MAQRGADPIQVRGLRDLQRALRDVNKAYPRELRVVNKEVAEMVVGHARARALAMGGVAAKSAPSIRAAAEQRRAKISLGGARFPYALGAEFGGGKFGKGNPTPGGGYTTQFPPWRGRGSGAGYFLYPTIRRDEERIVDAYEQRINELIARIFDR